MWHRWKHSWSFRWSPDTSVSSAYFNFKRIWSTLISIFLSMTGKPTFWLCSVTLPNKNLKWLCHPIRSKTKTKCDWSSHVFPRFASAATWTCIYLEFWLFIWIVWFLKFWWTRLLWFWFWFYDSWNPSYLHISLLVLPSRGRGEGGT